MAQLPKLSRAMRVSTNLDGERNSFQDPLKKFAVKRIPGDENEVAYKDVTRRLQSSGDSKSLTHLQNLWRKAKELLGPEEPPEVVDDAVMFILKLLWEETKVSMEHVSAMKRIFGVFSSQAANSLFEFVKDLRSCLRADNRSFLQECFSHKTAKALWGAAIECQMPQAEAIDVENLKELGPSAVAACSAASEFSMRYDHYAPAASAAATNGVSERKYTRNWLADFVPVDLVESLVNMLKSQKSSDELQNELFDMLGFDKFEAIQEILRNRQVIVKLAENEEKRLQLKEKAIMQKINRPQVGNQVIIQSENEKQMMKQLRKEEQKLKKLAAKVDSEDFNIPEEIDPAKFRILGHQALSHEAKFNPLLHDRPKAKLPAKSVIPRYPNVYDSQLEAKSHVGFVSGGRLMLPDNVERKDSKTFEEVRIPACDPPPLAVGNVRVKVEDLDEIGKIAFKGTKELNRIQSVVYPTAYHSNDNMLVCAPTGAGKTNVAMLAIVHTIRSFVTEGIIDRSQFKIVYVAPMKALAAEMTENFGKRLKALGIAVRELTGDMQLTKAEMLDTQMIVTTPEKWDVVTRKGAGDVAMISLVKLLIIDEVHLLHGERGPVVEALVARTLRLVESSQSMIRIVGLSATLPNYIDVARFLRVNPMIGLFFFDSRFRPIPLGQVFIGVKAQKPLQQLADMDQICYDKCVEMLKKGHQVMVFVHARNATVRTAVVLREMAQQKQQLGVFAPEDTPEYGLAKRAIAKSRNKQLVELFHTGLAMHHAGMLRTDRSLVEKYFADGHIRVLVCTATLAWGVNLPAHAVIIKGTEIYDSKHGTFIDLGILDVLQIFGRAGRPQFDKSGVGMILTSHDKLSHYLSLLTNQFPIESNFIQCLADNLNAEITLGTISNVDEAIEWLSYTYLFVRMRINPQVYGMNYTDVQADFTLERKRRELIHAAAMALDKARMIRYNTRTHDLNVTDLGRTASHFYVKYDTVEVFNEMMRPLMTEAEILEMMSHAQEFQQLKVRDDEMDELDLLTHEYCEVVVRGGSENLHGKVNILMQTYLSRGFVKSFSLISDMSYITQNAVRIARALFTIVLRQNNPILAGRLLMMSIMFEKQMWDFETPLRQFHIIPQDVIEKIENRGLSIYALREMDSKEIGDMLRNHKYGSMVKRCAEEFPILEIDASLQPITRTVLRIRIFLTGSFKWNDRVHGRHSESFWVWIEDPESNFIYHSEIFQLTKKQAITREPQELVMTIPLKDPLPPQYYIRVSSDLWLGSHTTHPLSFQHLILPEIHPPHTELLPLQPLPVAVLKNPKYESLFAFSHFNPIQTQIFHCLYHTDNNVLLGAPTGSGKTIAAEIAIFRVFEKQPKAKVVYIAPLKALVRERIEDWRTRLEHRLGKKVVELTGDVTPDIRAIRDATVIVTTPEKWDGISRSWQTRDYVKDVALIVIDEIHLLGEDRGPVLEVIVSRTNFISNHTERNLRIIGLSTALANAKDLANWLGIEQMGLYNFKPSVRPVPLTVHISGYPGKHYCPRMATMNRPTYQAIRQYSPCTPALVFVSSRRQTRLTALDLIAFLATEDNPKQFLHCSEDEMEQILQNIHDANLKLTLAFGIGLHHAGLQERDRKTCEELFLNRKIQVLVATATLAWGVNLPAHLVVIKGTEYYDGKQKRYVDMPITDVLQMMGRAGRPQFGNEGIAVVLVHDIKKNFYKKFLYDPFPVESSLHNVIPDHVNAEIVAGTVQTKQGILDYLTWTYFFRRLLRNPTYYNLDSIEPEDVNRYLTSLVESVLQELDAAGCVEWSPEDRYIYPTSLGRISSYYYLSHKTMNHFSNSLGAQLKSEELLRIMCDSFEFDQQPVRHNEDKYNEELSQMCRFSVPASICDSPHTKTFLLMQAHFGRLPLPNADYHTDTKSVLDQAIRILQAMIDVCAEKAWLASALRVQELMQSVIQARWFDDSPLTCLPFVEEHHVAMFDRTEGFAGCGGMSLPVLRERFVRKFELVASPLRDGFLEREIEEIHRVLKDLPVISVNLALQGPHLDDPQADRTIVQPQKRDSWLEIHAGEEYTLAINFHRLGAKQGSSIYCPKFPKGKDEGWFLTLGCQNDQELIALKRAAFRGSRSTQYLVFDAPKRQGRVIYTLYLVSDCFMGLDQQFDVQLEVIPGTGKREDEAYAENYARFLAEKDV
ncbi:activating signal cointegrator 1 complex subunit 3 [Phlebotomus argentipes]|uniref:activating signal cointegrator 1 complex subunit 3 n=1 Tax=Phlebotomus argentipes TaxID=94469 RepID=UPI002892E3D8|nr:activating signal cointegrator 1 complex subunit 3 [Phlebotomus argentipes]